MRTSFEVFLVYSRPWGGGGRGGRRRSTNEDEKMKKGDAPTS